MQNIVVYAFLAVFTLTNLRIFGDAAPVEQAKAAEPPKAVVELRKFGDDVPLTDEDMQVLVDDALDYAHNVAFITRTKEQLDKSDVAAIAPFALFPSPYPRQYFEQALSVQKAMNELYFRISCDSDFLEEVHREVLETDLPVKKMVDIVRQIKKDGIIRQPISVVLQRADYMLDVIEDGGAAGPKYEIKQVEVNNGPIGSAGLVPRATLLHRRILDKAGVPHSTQTVSDNRATTTLAEGLYEAWKLFGDKNAIILIVQNAFSPIKWDQRHIQYDIDRLSNHTVKMVVMPLVACGEWYKDGKLTLNPEDHKLRVNDQVVAVVYQRGAINCGGGMKDEKWNVQLVFERSTAIKAPTVALVLASTKKVQQHLALPGMVERFFPEKKDAETVAAIRATFAGLWSLNSKDDATKKAVEDAIAHPENYVLKPNREGGGNNIWGEKIAEKLKSFTDAQRAEHILMQRLHPIVFKNYMVQPLKPVEMADMVTELSIYGALVGNQLSKEVLHNVGDGFMMRSKFEKADEGGILAGNGVYDSPYLY